LRNSHRHAGCALQAFTKTFWRKSRCDPVAVVAEALSVFIDNEAISNSRSVNWCSLVGSKVNPVVID